MGAGYPDGTLCFYLSLTAGSSVCYTLAGSSGDTCFSNNAPFDNANNYLPESPADIGKSTDVHCYMT